MRDATPKPFAADLSVKAAEHERGQATAVAAGVRLGAVGVFLALALGLGLGARQAIWEACIPPLAAYALVALVFFLVRRHPLARQLAWLPPLFDVAAFYLLARGAIALARPPGAAAGFAIGPLVLVVALATLTLRPAVIYAVAGSSAVALMALSVEAGLNVTTGVAGAVVLVAAALIGHAVVRRVAGLAVELAQAEVARQLERRRITELDASRQTIARMLDEAQDQNERLERLQRDKESLVQLIVHDLRSPLNAIMLSLEYVTQDLVRRGSAGDLLEALDDARTTSGRLGLMIAQILDTAKLEEGRLTLESSPLPAFELLDKARHELGVLARNKQIEIDIDAAPGLSILADPRLFPRVMENLLSNSIRHTPPGGRIRLVAARAATETVLSIHNNGAPVDAANRERIFQKFQQEDGTPQRLSGWGLGLYFCRMVVEAHGGRIGVEDIAPWPTSFVIRLPG